jgi:hypothetical protein
MGFMRDRTHISVYINPIRAPNWLNDGFPPKKKSSSHHAFIREKIKDNDSLSFTICQIDAFSCSFDSRRLVDFVNAKKVCLFRLNFPINVGQTCSRLPVEVPGCPQLMVKFPLVIDDPI